MGFPCLFSLLPSESCIVYHTLVVDAVKWIFESVWSKWLVYGFFNQLGIKCEG